MPALRSLLLGLVTVLAVLVLHPEAGHAAASPWSEATGARLRLIAPGGPPAADGTLTLGIEIALEPGWKTYWRHPGEAGLPPEIDFSGSDNLAEARVDFPAPRRFVDGGSTSIGYGGSVVLPVRLRPEDPALPVMVSARILYGACKELCVPATGEARLMVSRATRADASAATLLAAAEAALPASASADFRITAVDRSPDDAYVLVVSALLPDPARPSELFAEGPGAAFPGLPVPLEADGAGPPRWRVTLDRHGPASGPLRLTLVNGERALEQVWELP